MHVYYMEARWELTCEELTLFMQLEAKYTWGASLTPHNRNYIHSTCYNCVNGDRPKIRQNGSGTHLARILVRINCTHLYLAMTGRISVSVRVNKASEPISLRNNLP